MQGRQKRLSEPWESQLDVRGGCEGWAQFPTSTAPSPAWHRTMLPQFPHFGQEEEFIVSITLTVQRSPKPWHFWILHDHCQNLSMVRAPSTVHGGGKQDSSCTHYPGLWAWCWAQPESPTLSPLFLFKFLPWKLPIQNVESIKHFKLVRLDFFFSPFRTGT